jgi:hypothetical protein
MNNRYNRVPVYGRGLANRYYGDGLGNIIKAMVKGASAIFKRSAPKLKKAGIKLLKSTGNRLKEAGKDYIKDNKEEITNELKKLGKRATKIASQEAEEAVEEILKGQNVKETLKKRGKKALQRTGRSAQARGKRVSKAQASKIQDILEQQRRIAAASAKEAAMETKTEIAKDLEKTGKKLRREIDKDINDLKLSSLFIGEGLVQLGRKRKGNGLKRLGK